MQKLITAVMMMIIAGCTPMPVKETPPIESVIDMPGFNKDQIYTATKVWIAENFMSAKAVIENDDKEAGRVIGNGRIKYPCSGFSCISRADWTLDFTMRVDIKDQKIRLTFTNLGFSFPSTQGIPAADDWPIRENQMGDVRPALIKLGEELKDAITKEKTKADW